MSTLASVFRSSIGKKILMSLTGLFLCSYLVIHLAGNLLLLKPDSGAGFDQYAELLPSLTIIKIIEYGLYAVFLLHMISGTVLWFQNRAARPQKYAANHPEANSSFFSRTMFLTGSIIFIFLVIHMKQFWVNSRFTTEEHFSMYRAVTDVFSNGYYDVFYLIAMGLLAFHLRHGFQSAFQTFGLKATKLSGLIEALGVIFWLVIPVGFAIIPVYFFLKS